MPEYSEGRYEHAAGFYPDAPDEWLVLTSWRGFVAGEGECEAIVADIGGLVDKAAAMACAEDANRMGLEEVTSAMVETYNQRRRLERLGFTIAYEGRDDG